MNLYMRLLRYVYMVVSVILLCIMFTFVYILVPNLALIGTAVQREVGLGNRARKIRGGGSY